MTEGNEPIAYFIPTGRLSIAMWMFEAIGGRVVIEWKRGEAAISRHGIIRFVPFRDGNDIADAVIDFRDGSLGLGRGS